METSENTFLQVSHISQLKADTITYLIFTWLNKLTQCEWTYASEEADETFYKFCRNVAKKAAWHEFRQIGGPHDIVEIDQNQLLRKKYKGEKATKSSSREKWILGGISRTTKKVFVKIVPERTVDNVLPILQDCIDSESFICSDTCNVYNMCSVTFAGHGTINHLKSFLEPPSGKPPLWASSGRFKEACLDCKWKEKPPLRGKKPYRIHIQNMKNVWKRLKELIDDDINRELLPEYLGEFMYRQNVLRDLPKKDQFQRFCQDIQRAYPGIGKKPMTDNYDECQCHICEPN